MSNTLVPNLSVLFASLLWLKKQAKLQIQLLLLLIGGLHGSILKCPETDGSKKFVPALIYFSTSVVQDGDDLEKPKNILRQEAHFLGWERFFFLLKKTETRQLDTDVM